MTDAISSDARFAARLRARREREFRAARRHSIFVRILRWALPASGVVASVGFVITTVIIAKLTGPIDLGPVTVDVEQIQDTDEGLVMVEPRVTGTSSKDQPFEVKASRAWQDPKNTKLVNFENVDASLGMEEGAKTRLTARKGLYDMERETLRISGDVRIRSTEGYSAEMEEAFVDFAIGALRTEKRIMLESDEMRIEATAAKGSAGEQRIEFSGPVRLVIRPRASAAPKAQVSGEALAPENASTAAN